jgi:hypothetical protein
LLDSFEWTGTSQRHYSAAKQAGPLATFEGADSWVERPYANVVALLGDTAANSDPFWGQGLSLSLVLSATRYSATGTWTSPAVPMLTNKTAYTILRTVTGWLREFFLVTGPSADARRAHALPLIGQDKARVLSGSRRSPACSARMLLRLDPRRCPLLELFLERGELLAQCLQLSS